mmetsp:Transcript_96429/g.267922  ORF Transcript_96429/g.267922 Transcript_96429/m.267922 type:complete len:246 (+) Transcript_96429:336-1073(+)
MDPTAAPQVAIALPTTVAVECHLSLAEALDTHSAWLGCSGPGLETHAVVAPSPLLHPVEVGMLSVCQVRHLAFAENMDRQAANRRLVFFVVGWPLIRERILEDVLHLGGAVAVPGFPQVVAVAVMPAMEEVCPQDASFRGPQVQQCVMDPTQGIHVGRFSLTRGRIGLVHIAAAERAPEFGHVDPAAQPLQVRQDFVGEVFLRTLSICTPHWVEVVPERPSPPSTCDSLQVVSVPHAIQNAPVPG